MAILLRALGVAFLLSAGVSLPSHGKEQESLVWPFGSAQPRVEFVRSFERPADLGIGKSFFERLKDIFFGASEARILRPMAVAVSNGIVYVADPGARGVHRFDTGVGQYALIAATGNAPLLSPVGLALGAAGEIYVTDSKLAQVFVIRPGAKDAVPLRLDAKLTQPTGIAYDVASGHIYVVDTAEHRVQIFERDGSLSGSIGRRGGGDGEFNYPTYLWRTPQGNMYVTDSLNFRIQSFDAHGQFTGKISRHGDGTGDASRPKGVATDRYGHLYVVDALFHAFQIFDATGRLLLPVGERGQGRGEFWLPTGIFIDDETIYVADSYNRRVQVFRYIGGAT
ncbi:MAG: 6-bladed beta-propeller [Proteobacteria bacterium]|nr:6-bladed beta-propeller [Pseudomonadota bacterium]